MISLFLNIPKYFEPKKDLPVTLKLNEQIDDNIIVVGDSHARTLLYGLNQITSGFVKDITSNGCIPLLNIDRWDSRFKQGQCSTFITAELEKVLIEDPKAILILNSMGPVYLEGTAYNEMSEPLTFKSGMKLTTDLSLNDRYEIYEIGLRLTLDKLSKLKNTKTFLLLDAPELGILNGCNRSKSQINLGPFNFSYNSKPVNDCFTPREEYNKRSEKYRNLLYNTISNYPEIVLVDASDVFCDRRKCHGFDQNFGYLYSDTHHLSEAGSLKMVEYLQNFLHK